MKIREVMKRVVVVEKDLSLREAGKIMAERGIGSLVLIKNDKIAGIATERDVVENISELGKKISEITRKTIITIDEDETLEKAGELMAKHKIKRLPVLKKGKLVGIITATDIIDKVDDLNEEFFFD
jgi:CBS domain-containing protein